MGGIIRAFVNFAVALFFFLSGYLTIIDIDTKSLWKRVKKVLLPYVVWSLLYALLSGKNGLTILTGNVLLGLATGTCSFHLYFVLVYIQITMLTKVCTFVLCSKFKNIFLFISPVAILVFHYLMPYAGVQVTETVVRSNFLVWLSYYYIGLGIGNHKLNCSSNRVAIITTSAFLYCQ